MKQINWNQFSQKAESRQKSFEDLSMFLCCRDLGISRIEAYQNQPGIETEPFIANGKKYGFQAKFFDGGFDWEQIKKSVAGKQEVDSGAIDKRYPNNIFAKYKLDTLFIYSNKDKTLDGRKKVKDETSKTEAEKLLDELAEKYKAKIEFVTDKAIQLKLSNPSNFDLAQLFFGLGDEFGYIKNSTNPEILTFLQSSEYLELPFADKEKNKVSDVVNLMVASASKEFLITGHPGSGKSIFMHKSLQVFGGLDKDNESGRAQLLIDNNAVPVLVNLKDCATDSLENILRERKNDSKVNNQEFGFIYLFDGLDELSEENADNALSQIYELKNRSGTKKIIVSCRSGNPNKIKAKEYFNEIVEYKISELEETFIDNYFLAKKNNFKRRSLAVLKKNNKALVKDIKDIFLIKLLWDTVEELNESSTITDLFQKKIDLLLETPKHRKNIEGLNLPNPKKEAIIKLNQDISFEFQKKFQFRFSQEELQKLILKRFERLDYKSADAILNYIADLFFENSFSDAPNSHATYIYQHRRYQEFFFAQKLKREYEENPKILRELKILSNKEFFEDLFLKYVRKEYERENNLAGLIELNLIDVYLGKHGGYGADEPYYFHSSEFIPSLLSQSVEVFNELIEDENLQLKDKIKIDFETVVALHKTGKQQFLRSQRISFRNWFVKKDSSKSETEYKNRLVFEQFESYVYCKIILDQEDVERFFLYLIRGNYKNASERSFGYEETGKEKLVKSFFRVCLKEKRDELFKLIDSFDEYEFLAFLDVLRTIEYLPVFVQSQTIHQKLKDFVENFSGQLNETNSFVLFFKKFFNLNLTKNENDFAHSEIGRVRIERKMDWSRRKIQFDYALASFVLDANSFDAFSAEKSGRSSYYYDELGLCAALFRDFLNLLTGQKKIEAIVRDYLGFIRSRKRTIRDGVYLGKDLSELWANIFARSNAKKEDKLTLKNLLIKEENGIFPLHFFLELNRVNAPLFYELINESDLQNFEEHLQAWESDYQSYADRCFELARLFSGINQEKARLYITKGINDGTLRHGWRKDTIVSYQLVDALEILWKNNWETQDNLKEFTNKVFELTLRLDDITDGKETWRGPYNVVELIANYDINFAENLKNRLIEKNPSHNFSNIVITSVLLGKVNLGVSLEEIERGMDELRQDYDYQGRPESDYYEQKIRVYLKIAEHELYTEDVKKDAFKKACAEYEEMQSLNLSHYMSDRDFKNEKLKLVELSKKYGKKLKVTFDEKTQSKKKTQISERKFIKDFERAKTKEKISKLYFDLRNHQNEITLSNVESWEILINKTSEICNDIRSFTEYLMERHFPSYAFWTYNSEIGLAVALKNINTRQEVLKYLSKDTGHGGFLNVMKAYEINKDKKMCLLLFERYLKFCNFIVN